MGKCLDFGLDSKIVKIASFVGSLIASPMFSNMMILNRSKCISYIHSYINGSNPMTVDSFCEEAIRINFS